jgi:hypothetical protein
MKEDDEINCISWGNRYELTKEECPKCETGNYRYDRFSSKDIGNHGDGSVEPEKELDDLLGAVDNPNRRRILKFLLEGEKSRSYTSHPYIIDHIDSMSYNRFKGSM